MYQKQRMFDRAVTLLQEYIILAPKAVHPRTELAKIYHQQNRLDEAEACLLENLLNNPGHLQSRTELAKIYQRQKRLDEAADEAEQILRYDPLNTYAMSELLVVWNRRYEKKTFSRRFADFIRQPGFKVKSDNQTLICRAFLCCRKFNMLELAGEIFGRFSSQLDKQNRTFYSEKLTMRKRA